MAESKFEWYPGSPCRIANRPLLIHLLFLHGKISSPKNYERSQHQIFTRQKSFRNGTPDVPLRYSYCTLTKSRFAYAIKTKHICWRLQIKILSGTSQKGGQHLKPVSRGLPEHNFLVSFDQRSSETLEFRQFRKVPGSKAGRIDQKARDPFSKPFFDNNCIPRGRYKEPPSNHHEITIDHHQITIDHHQITIDHHQITSKNTAIMPRFLPANSWYIVIWHIEYLFWIPLSGWKNWIL